MVPVESVITVFPEIGTVTILSVEIGTDTVSVIDSVGAIVDVVDTSPVIGFMDVFSIVVVVGLTVVLVVVFISHSLVSSQFTIVVVVCNVVLPVFF